MGRYERELDRIAAGDAWRIESSRALHEALTVLGDLMSDLLPEHAWTGTAAGGARQSLDGLRSKIVELAGIVGRMNDVVEGANLTRDRIVAGADLPAADLDPFWRTAVTTASTIVHPVLGPLASDTALDVIEGWLGSRREDAAKEKVDSLRAGLDHHAVELRELARAADVAAHGTTGPSDAPGGSGDPGTVPPAYVPGGRGVPLPRGHAGSPGASVGSTLGVPSVDGDSGGSAWEGSDDPRGGSGGSGGAHGGHGGGGEGGAQGGGHGSLPGGTTGGGSLGGPAGAGVLAGGVGTAALGAGTRMAAGLGSLGAGGVRGGGAAFGAVAGSGGIGGGGANALAGRTGGLLGTSGTTGGVVSTASGTPANGTGAGTGVGAGAGRSGMMAAPHGAAGSDDEKSRVHGLGGPVAPTLEDDPEAGPRAKGAGAGSR